MLNSDIRDQAYQFFIEEAPELLQVIETGLLTIRQDRSKPKVHEIMRAAHSIKGGAASVDLEVIKSLSHRLEDYFKALYQDEVVIDLELENLLLQAYDCLRYPLIEQIETGSFAQEEAWTTAEPIFAQIETKLGDALNNDDDYIPSSSDLGVDLLASIFEVDVLQGIEHLETVSSNPQKHDLIAELKNQGEIFLGLGELLGLPEFTNQVQAALAAVEANPKQVQTIIKLLAQDLKNTRNAVLAKDKTETVAEQTQEEFFPIDLDEFLEDDEHEIEYATDITHIQSSNLATDPAYQVFVEEAIELLEKMESGLLSIRQDYSPNKVHEIMRAAHSLKGGSASLGLEEIKHIAHHLEDFFKALHSQEITIDVELETLLLQGYDCLRLPLMEQITTGYYDQSLAKANAQPVFAKIETKLGDALKNINDYVDSSSDLGTNIVRYIFEVDVAEELQRLESVVSDPDNNEVRGEVRAMADVFSGFADLLNLPGFKAIATTTLEALELNPGKPIEIAQLFLSNCLASREEILSGNRSRGGAPTAELLKMANKTISLEEEFPVTSQGKQRATEEKLTILQEDIPEEFPADEIEDISALAQNDIAEEFPAYEIQEIITPGEQNSLEEYETISTGELNNNQENYEIIFPGSDNIFGYEDILGGSFEIDERSKGFPTLDDVFGFDQTNLPLNTELFDQYFEGIETSQPSLEDVFGEDDFSATPANLDSKNYDKRQLNTPTLEQVFGGDETVSADTQAENTSKINSNPSLEDLFGDTPSTYRNSESTEESASLTLEEVFNFSEENQSITEEVFNFSQGNTQPLIDNRDYHEDIFSFSQQDSNIEDQNRESSTEVSEAITPSLEDVFTLEAEGFEVSPELIDNRSGISEQSETLEESVKSIERAFAELPKVKQVPVNTDTRTKSAETESVEPNQAKNKAPQRQTQPAGNLSVRVDLNRLETMNNLVGEMSINRNSLSLQNDQLQSSVKELTNRFSRFYLMTNKLREIADQMLISPQLAYNNYALEGLSNQPQETKYYRSDFDSLEMDRYGTINSMLQGLLEEMMQIEESVDDVILFAKQSDQTLQQQRLMLTRVRDELMWARMLPLGELLNRFPRMLRDMSTTYNKPTVMKITGTGVLVDKAALEKLYDPLLHLVRNAFDHGIESRELRKKSGKPEEGLIEIKAYHKGNQTVIEINDDGQGINYDKIGRKAVDLGLLTPEQVAVVSSSRLLDLIFDPGFSTAAKVSELSGRGMGLDVVRTQLQALKGTIVVTSTFGQGTSFILRLPLTLTLAKLLVCLVGSTAVAFPSDSIEEIIIPDAAQIKYSGENRFLQLNQELVAVYSLKQLMKYNCSVPESFSSKALTSVPIPAEWASPLLVLRRGQQLIALEVERLVTEQELVIKPFGGAIAPPSYSYGCTIIGDGTLIPVINGVMLVEYLVDNNAHHLINNKGHSPNPNASYLGGNNTGSNNHTFTVETVLVVDDSTAMRRTIALTLEKAGYRVIQARDGKDALEQLQQGATVNMVICDIEMPNMNGFEFLGQRRRDPQLMNIPVAMLTSRSNDKHRRLAMQLGADAYFTKPYIEPEFVKAIKSTIKTV